MLLEKYSIPEDDSVITQKDMAKLLKVSVRTLIRWDKDNLFNCRRKPNDQPYYLKSDYYSYHEQSKKRGETHHV